MNDKSDVILLNRPPRVQETLPVKTVEIPSPPSNDSNSTPLWQTFVPLIGVIGFVAVSSANGISPIVIPMILAIAASTIVGSFNLLKKLRQDREKRRQYALRVSQLRREMTTDHNTEQRFFHYNYPSTAIVLQMDGKKAESRLGSRLWERRMTDVDFGVVRLGIGTRASLVNYVFNAATEISDDLFKDAEKLARDSQWLHDSPILLSLAAPSTDLPTQKLYGDVCHSIGIVGDKIPVSSFANAFLVHFAAFHSPVDSQINIIGHNVATVRWEWLTKLPHCGRNKSAPALAFELSSSKKAQDQSPVERYLITLRRELDRREMRLREGATSVAVRHPFIVLVIDLLDIDPDSEGVLGDIEADAAISKAIQRGHELGIAVVLLVPNSTALSSSLTCVIELSKGANGVNLFRSSRIGLNGAKVGGIADGVSIAKQQDEQKLNDFARNLSKVQVRQTYGSELMDRVSFLEMHNASGISDLNIPQYWQQSIERAEWLRVQLGLISGNEPREFVFSADADGIHGLIAGTTGSGKSELLMSLIIGLAIRYDPSIVNFVLIDFKGGALGDPFKNLPHCVDIVTNLNEAGVARMFASIDAEIRRRQMILSTADKNVGHIVDYREKNLHISKQPFPHLFIIIDEFAEMIAKHADFRAQLDSITRVGRSLGINLILAAQRPTGVSEQMQSNIKLRFCLRVETSEESKELLRRPDAADIPNGMPGRGYFRIGSSIFDQIQVSYTGEEYTEVIELDEIDFSTFVDKPVIWISKLITDTNEPPKFHEAVVKYMASLAPQQKKPWPSPIQSCIPLGWTDAIEHKYLPSNVRSLIRIDLVNGKEQITLCPALAEWLSGERKEWEGSRWDAQSLAVVVGIIDDPRNARLLPLTITLPDNHHLLFGASGWGKSTFLRGVILSLASKLSPIELNLYILDFGNRSLRHLKELPHTGAYILPEETERTLQLLRWLDEEMEYRKNIISKSNFDNIYSYNAQSISTVLPIIILVIDNFAEFKLVFEENLPELVSLAREGLPNGINIVITSDIPGSVPNNLYSVFGSRLTLKLTNDDYQSVLGVSVKGQPEAPGSGYITVGKEALAFQIAEPPSANNENIGMLELITAMNIAWKSNLQKPPQAIVPLGSQIDLREVIQGVERPHDVIQIPLGKDADQKIVTVKELRQQPHFAIVGPPISGRTTTLIAWTLSLAMKYPPDMVRLILVDRQRILFTTGGKYTLANLPHVDGTVSEPEEMEAAIASLMNIYNSPKPPNTKRADYFVLIDNFDDFVEVVPKSNFRELANLARLQGRNGLHIVIAGTQESTRLHETRELSRQVFSRRIGISLDTESLDLFGARVPRGQSSVITAPGRCFFVENRRAKLMQVAYPWIQDEKSGIGTLDHWVEIIKKQDESNRQADRSSSKASPPRNPKNKNNNTRSAKGQAKNSRNVNDKMLSDTPLKLDLEKIAKIQEEVIKKCSVPGLAESLRIKEQPLRNLIDLAKAFKVDLSQLGLDLDS